MDSSGDRRIGVVAVAIALAVVGCSATGGGEGHATGSVVAPSCDLDDAAFDLDPTFFGADPLDDFLSIRIQHGSEPPDISDGILVSVRSATDVESMLGVPITITNVDDPLTHADDPLVQLSLLLGRSCPSERDKAAVSMSAVSGTITFTAIYAQEGSKDRLIEATFDARFESSDDPATHADLAGDFRFNFSRGRPGQVFP